MHVAICLNQSGIDIYKIPLPSYYKAINETLKVTEQQIRGKDRHAEIAEARHILIYLTRTIDNYHSTFLGRHLNMDHSSVLYAVKSITNRLKTNHNNIQEKLQKIRNLL